MIPGVEANLSVATLADEIHLYASQAKMLTADFAEAERAREGVGDFLRSHFWRQRWRIYEIWLLTKTIDLLERTGAEITLQGVYQGIWHLRYGQNDSPVAIARYPNGALKVFYQYIDRSGDSGDMPDIFIADADNRAFLVLDPKHGRSYRRSTVQSVLTRYHNKFHAAITTIVNYYSMKSYQYDIAVSPGHIWLLASGVAPGTIEEQRLEYLIQDTACARGYFREATPKATIVPKKWTLAAAGLIYWARGSREVDEPKGAWCYTREKGARPLPRFAELTAMPVEGIEGSQDTQACALRAGHELILISSSVEQSVWRSSFPDIIDSLAWDVSGTRLVIKSGEQLTIFDLSGTTLQTFPAPTEHWQPEIDWIGKSDTILYAHQLSFSKVVAYRFGRDHQWKQILDFPPSRFNTIDVHVARAVDDDGLVLRVTDFHSFLVTADSIDELPPEQERYLSVSPSGRYVLRHGPVSFRAADGISLLEIQDRTGEIRDIPLVRFIGELTGSIRWNADETSFSFLTRRRFRSGIEDIRVSIATVGDRDAVTISLLGQSPVAFAWLDADLLKELQTT